ncbi:protein cupin-like super family [Candidatus Termititenax persephonae]|uniref:Protein cupin-like super family n=1 Tax=Candidatus Termititenax persephonae TaxID=2218525 RepID=A0A388TF82_9BACT|nr:protein cupin-like super family [Candidatus Termititenax persephonae]
MIENVTHDNQLLAIIVRHDYYKDGIEFFTPGDFSQQLAYMNHKKGYVIQPHVHNVVRREVLYTKEVLVVKRGRMRTDFYTDDREYVCSRELATGDVLLLAAGGHGFEMLADTEMYEIKQGPYAGDNDKTRFMPKMPN